MVNIAVQKPAADSQERAVVRALGARSVVLVGMMGAGKSSIGRRLAHRLGVPFVDADTEIESAAGMSIPEIFDKHGEPYFRAGEARVIARLLDQGPQVLATGGGAVMDPQTRALIRDKGISIWLKADIDVLLKRTKRRSDRPLVDRIKDLMPQREPIYALSDLVVQSRDEPHEIIVDEIMAALAAYPGCGGGGEQGMTAPLRSNELITVEVALGERTYDIAIGRGLLASLGARIKALRPGARTVIVTDENVAKQHLAAAQAALSEAGVESSAVVVTPGEGSKKFATFERVCEDIIAARIERGDLAIALGGGVIGDLAGFASSCVRRGLDFVQVPTSLLAQVDSSVGGKTGINSRHGKNLIGAFHQPVLVIADTALLDTLPAREFRAGYAEVAKYGLLGDEAFFAWLEANWREVFSGDSAREHAIAVSCRAKAGVVARDERETGERALLNLGHTFGHAFEAGCGFSDRLLHGEAVALGMVMAFDFSARKGLTSQAEADRARAHLAAVGLPTHVRDVAGGVPGIEALMDLIAQDKKVKRGKLTFILVRGIGQAFIENNVDPAEVRAFLAEQVAG